MYEELQTVGDPNLFRRNDKNQSRASTGQFACETSTEQLRPGWVKDEITSEWMVIVNTDAFPQQVTTESCS